jgi:hypothetical protein
MANEITVQTPETKPETDMDLIPQFHAVAVNGTEMVQAKAGIQSWLERKIQLIENEITSIQATYDAAIRNKWKSSTFKGQLQREKQKLLYYGKLLAACNAGFTIVPNMDVDVFAIRVKRMLPTAKDVISKATGYAPNAPRIDDETEERLPIGDGRYESPIQETSTERWDEKNEKGEIVHKVRSSAVDFADMEFPLAIAHPVVMDATARAMAMKIFDRIGIVRDRNQTSGDPIVLGQITRKVGWQLKTASFLIAWYLDPRTL